MEDLKNYTHKLIYLDIHYYKTKWLRKIGSPICRHCGFQVAYLVTSVQRRQAGVDSYKDFD